MRNDKYTFLNACADNNIPNGWEYVKELYLNGRSCNEIQEYLLTKYNIQVSAKHLSDNLKGMGVLRDYSERKLNAITRGRMIYRKKPKENKYKSLSVSQKLRFKVLTRDKFRCVLCGNTPNNGTILEIHHKIPANNDLNNLQTLCYNCHRGLHYSERDAK
uniref:Putative homing endonuclease n=1 Tax=viral metagenome TaxID=1070528 RepID=A0A6M3IL35_9ZZZZ